MDVDGDVVEYIAIRHDITELEETKQQLRNINKAMKHKVDELYSMTNSLEEKAYKDNLTGINNRENFEKFFEVALNNATRNKEALSLLIFDIDHFKLINDTFGHQAGDIILIEIATLISSKIKNTDVFARWGGEEFVILLPSTSVNDAFTLAENLRILITKNIEDKLTVSFGVAQFEEGEDKINFFERADEALYKAKKMGRNKVEVYKKS